MSFREFAEESREIIARALDSLGYPKPASIEWSEPPDKSFGDLSFRVGFQLSKDLKKKPGDIATEIAARANMEATNRKLVSTIASHPSGFLNFTLNKVNFAHNVVEASTKEGYGKTGLGNRESVLVEHTAVNPNKALHIGHLRNVALGDSLARIFRFAGYDTYVLNYIDDSGLQVADIIVGMLYLGFSKEGPLGQKYDHYAGDSVYVEVNRRYEKDPSLKERQKRILKAIEERDPEIFPFASEVTDMILKEQLHTCWRFGARYDLLVYESDIIATKLWHSLFEELKEKGIARFETEGKLAGCWIVSVKGEEEGEDKVLVRSDGTATYIAKDTPFAALKIGLIADRFAYEKYTDQPGGKQLFRTLSTGTSAAKPVPWGSGKSLTVIDIRQARLQRIIQYVLEQLSGKDLKEKYVHVGYSIISLSAKTAASLSTLSGGLEEQGVVTMSGRRGTYVNADDAIDHVKKRALEETKKRNPEVQGDQWLEHVAEKLAVAALRFSLLKQDLDKMIVFDMEDSLKLIGETGPYMLYTYARASNIIAKLGEQSETRNADGGLLASESEMELVKTISKFDIAIEKAVKMLAPKWVAHYSFELCEAFNKFYESSRVIQEPDAKLRDARIELVKSTRNVLKSSLDLLGIEVLDKI